MAAADLIGLRLGRYGEVNKLNWRLSLWVY
jgi:hypothetical protein